MTSKFDMDARTIADLVKDGEPAAANRLYLELARELMLWESGILQDRVASILDVEYPRWKLDQGAKTSL